MRLPLVISRKASAVLMIVWITLGAAGNVQALPPRTAIILAINDVYRIEGLHYNYDQADPDGQKGVGGLARVRTLRDELDARQRGFNQNLLYELEDILQRNQLDNAQRIRHETLRDTLKKEMEEHNGGSILLLHAGDLLFPSLLSRTYNGEQMIKVLNCLAGSQPRSRHQCLVSTQSQVHSAEQVKPDEKMIVVFGNHEFEAPSCKPNQRNLLQNRH